MGNVALIMRAKGHTITGSDQNMYPPMSEILANEGITLFSGFSVENINNPDLVVIGNKISRGNIEVEHVLNQKMAYTSMSELLKNELILGKNSIVISGTHGKTTTSSLMAWVLETAGLKPNFLIGGALGNFGAGWQFNSNSDFVVLEGDEYDTAFFDKRSKFVHYLPTDLIINNIEFDHADIFNSLDEIKLSFKRLINIVPQNGLIVYNSEDQDVVDVLSNAFSNTHSFGLIENSDWRATNIEYYDNFSTFDLYFKNNFEAKINVALIGEFNIRNSVAVIAVARKYNISYEKINEGLATFVNTKRRLELKGNFNNILVYDDFAHHPTAIKATLKALRQKHAGMRIWGIFEPRSNTTRRSVFQQELTDCFDEADVVVISQIDRLEELPINERLNPEKVITDLQARGKQAYYLPNATEIANFVSQNAKPNDVVVVMSNGGFDNIHGKIKDLLS